MEIRADGRTAKVQSGLYERVGGGGVEGGQSVAVDISFPKPFNKPPLVHLTPTGNRENGGDAQVHCWLVGSPTERGFTARVLNACEANRQQGKIGNMFGSGVRPGGVATTTVRFKRSFNGKPYFNLNVIGNREHGGSGRCAWWVQSLEQDRAVVSVENQSDSNQTFSCYWEASDERGGRAQTIDLHWRAEQLD